MNDTAINVQHLSKRYTIGAAVGQQTFREALISGAKAPLRRMRSALRGGGSVAATRDFWALRDISFEVKRGEVVGIIGRNGAGKSTLLKILSRITGPTGGYAEIHGRVGTLLEVGTGFHPELTGRENMYLNGAILGMSRADIDRKFDEIVAFAEVEQFIDTMVKHYSSGMYLRLAFAVAAHLEPEILIVDEVLAVGDAQFQRKCLGKMGEVAKEGRTVLFVSHNMGAVRSLCSRAIWLHDGAVRMDSGTYEVIDQYLQQTTTSTSSMIDLNDIPRNELLATRLKLTNITFNNGTPPMYGEPLRVEFGYETTADVYGVSFSFGFSSLEGTRMLSLDSDVGGLRMDLPRGSSGVAVATLDALYLQPGIYMLDVAARSGDRGFLDSLGGCAQVEITSGPDTPSVVIDFPGGVRFPVAWQWDDHAVAERG
jgi:lipopolysaccharide transport system ATP-binding protein